MGNYYQKDIECAEREVTRDIQSRRLAEQVRHVWENVKPYRIKMEEAGITPEDIKSVDDLSKLPFTEKSFLRDNYPDGLLAVPTKDCVRIHSTSGTTGKRVIAYYTQDDIDLWEDCCARAIVAAGGTDEDVCQVAYGYGLFTGGAGLNGAALRFRLPPAILKDRLCLSEILRQLFYVVLLHMRHISENQ